MNIFYLPLILFLPFLQVECAPLDDESFNFDSDDLFLEESAASSNQLASSSDKEKDIVLYFEADKPAVLEALVERYDDVTVDGKSRRKRATIIVVGDTTYYVHGRRKTPKRKFRPSPLLG